MRLIATVVGLSLLAGCQAPPNSDADDRSAASNAVSLRPSEESDATDGIAGEPDASTPPPPHLDPDAPPPPDESTAVGAARRLQEYCDAIATHRYGDAYRLWSDDGKATGMSQEEFARSFGAYADYDCHIGPPGRIEGAAGSLYVTVPLQVTGALNAGRGYLLQGEVVMRRVNDVPGSSAEQRRWHIHSSSLKPRP